MFWGLYWSPNYRHVHTQGQGFQVQPHRRKHRGVSSRGCTRSAVAVERGCIRSVDGFGRSGSMAPVSGWRSKATWILLYIELRAERRHWEMQMTSQWGRIVPSSLSLAYVCLVGCPNTGVCPDARARNPKSDPIPEVLSPSPNPTSQVLNHS